MADMALPMIDIRLVKKVLKWIAARRPSKLSRQRSISSAGSSSAHNLAISFASFPISEQVLETPA